MLIRKNKKNTTYRYCFVFFVQCLGHMRINKLIFSDTPISLVTVMLVILVYSFDSTVRNDIVYLP